MSIIVDEEREIFNSAVSNEKEIRVEAKVDEHMHRIQLDGDKPMFNAKAWNKRGFAFEKLGNCIVLYYHDGKPLVILGPDWMIFLTTLIPTLGFASIYVYSCQEFLGNALYFLLPVYITFFSSFLYTSLANPGIPTLTNDELLQYHETKQTLLYCSICNLYALKSKKRLYHCRDCGLCVQGYDHHCPFVSKCIGKNNLIVFYIFVCFAAFSLISTFFSIFFILDMLRIKK